MEILNFSQFKLILEAGGDTPEPADPTTPVTDPTAPPPPGTEPPTSSSRSGGPTSSSIPPPPMGGPLELPDDPNAPQLPNQPKPTRFVLLDDKKDWHTKYTDGGGVKRYEEYEIQPGEIEQWITDNQLDSRKDEILTAIKGKSQLTKDLHDRIKDALSSKKLGKPVGTADVVYDPNNTPATPELDTNFLKTK